MRTQLCGVGGSVFDNHFVGGGSRFMRKVGPIDMSKNRHVMDSNHTVELIGFAFEIAGVAVLAVGSLLAFVRFLVSLFTVRDG